MRVARRLSKALGLAGIATALVLLLTTHHSVMPKDALVNDYADPEACSRCHPAIARVYSLTGMGRSFRRLTSQNNGENFANSKEFFHRASGRYYANVFRNGVLFQQRHEIGRDGKPVNIVAMSVDYVIGSGNHARTYLHRTGEGNLIELPLTWYSENGGQWAMSPGYDRSNPSDFRRAISYECFSCHNAYPVAAKINGDAPVFGELLPEGIDCQRCHGPGRAHVAAASSPHPKPDSIRNTIVNPARRSRRQQLEVCMQCHLQSSAIRSPDAIRRFDRPPFSYRPGEPLGQFSVFFDFPGDSGRFEIDHAAYRLLQSACFRGSQMTCTTCHDPHQPAQGMGADARYRAVCRSCHAAAHADSTEAAFADCLGCHMPKRRPQDVVHVIMTDHFIQRRRPDGDLIAPLAEAHDERSPYRGEVALYDAAGFHFADGELYRAVAQARQEGNPDLGIATLRSAIERIRPAGPEFYFELGKAYRRAARNDEAIYWLEQALQRRPGFRPALKEFAATLSATGQLVRAAEILRSIAPDSGTLNDLGNVLLQQGEIEKAEELLGQALSKDSDLATARNLLGLASLRKNDQPGAEASFREAIRIQPDFAEARINLGNLLAASGNLREAIDNLRVAVVNEPESVEAHFDLGEALAASGAFDPAMEELGTVLRLNPNHAHAHIDLGRLLSGKGLRNKAVMHYRRAIESDSSLADAHYLLAGALAQNRDRDEAEREYRRAIELNPDFYEAHFALGQLLMARGNVDDARSHFDAASRSPDPRLRSAALRLR